MKIGIATDHHGIEIKEELINYLKEKDDEAIDYGTKGTEMVDYPEFAFKVGEAVAHNEIDYGILLCGTGIGMSIACNKVKHVFCAKVSNKKEAQLARNHNFANAMALSSSMPFLQMKQVVDTFLTSLPSTEERHIKRVQMIDEY